MSVFLRRILGGCTAAFALFTAPQLSAADLALVLANSDYRSLPDVREARALRDLASDLAEEGFEVIAAYDQGANGLIEAAQRFRRRSAEADRILIVLGGHIASSPNDSWLIGVGARRPDGFTIQQSAVSLSGLAAIASETAGRAVILVGPAAPRSVLGDGLGGGTSGLDVPQGVTLARGSYAQINEAVFEGLLRRGQSLDSVLSELSARGFVSDKVGFSKSGRSGGFGDIAARSEQEGFWTAARAINSIRAMQLYLDQYPNGRYRDEAEQRIAALKENRNDRWEQIERQLGLTRSDRRRIQRHLTILGFDTRGVDGIFGSGTRNAIGAWQRANGYQDTGFLNRQQLAVLTTQGQNRERIRAEELARQDDAYWRNTGARGTIDGLRAYLERYPNGRHAGDARETLNVLEDDAYWENTGGRGSLRGLRAYLERYPRGRHAEEARRQLRAIEDSAEEDERAVIIGAWRRARDADTIEAYRAFVTKYPNSPEADSARVRIRELREKRRNALLKQAKKEEKDNLKNQVVRLLVEQRLVQLGYRPGAPDGKFTDRTRAALRKFQGDRNLFESGYVTDRTAAFLLTGR